MEIGGAVRAPGVRDRKCEDRTAERGEAALSGQGSTLRDHLREPLPPVMGAVLQARRRFTMTMLIGDFANAPEPVPG